MGQLNNFIADESGATAIEYAILAAMIAVGIITSLMQVETSIAGLYQRVAEQVSEVANRP